MGRINDNKIFSRICNILKDIDSQECLRMVELLNLNDIVQATIKREEAKLPFHLNLLSSLTGHDIHETSHSAILNNLLHNEKILKSFLNRFCGEDWNDFTTKDIRTPEKDKMDLSICSSEKCLIFENKINGAEDRDSQIYTYVDRALKGLITMTGQKKYTPESTKVIYLTSTHRRKPEEQSLTFLNGDEVWRIPKVIEDSMVLIDFSHDIYEWLIEEREKAFLKGELFLYTALHQYVDYLEQKYCKSSIYDNMKEEIRKTINNELFSGENDTTDPDCSKRLKILEDLERELNAFKDNVSDYMWDLQRINDRIVIEKSLQKLNLSLINMSVDHYDEENYGVKFTKNSIDGYIAFGYDSYQGQQYVGIAGNTALFSDTYKKQLSKSITELGLNPEEQAPVWIAWAYINDNTILPQVFLNLIEVMLRIAKNPSYKLTVG